MTGGYCSDLLRYQRRITTEVIIGGIPMGGNNPIRIQTMTNTATNDVAETIEQILRTKEAGADYVRLTVPSLKDAENLFRIMDGLKGRDCFIPVIADIHFNPAIAKIAATVVHKVRVNPGNYTDKKQSRIIDYTKEQYQQELLSLKLEFKILLDICKKHKTALRIGTNHGSLSDRIMSLYGDTPEGMAESAMEFLRICREEDFSQAVISMKASNTRTMVYATRLLVSKMNSEGMSFPIHLGVTEAGEGEDGRIRSAIGIGALLADGIGDTIRVSLTEDPEAELPVARKIVDHFEERKSHRAIPAFGPIPIDPFHFKKRVTHEIACVGGNNPNNLAILEWSRQKTGKIFANEQTADILKVNTWSEKFAIPKNKYILIPYSAYVTDRNDQNIYYMEWEQYCSNYRTENYNKAIRIAASELTEEKIEKIKDDHQVIIILETNNINGFADQRAAIFRLMNKGCQAPVILRRFYTESDPENFQLKASCDLGGLFIDGLAEGIWLEDEGLKEERMVLNTSFNILQFSRVRTTKTEYISCPSCGRTLFDLQSTTKKIRERTSHLKGLKIGIMGCIVNGPGEMADADYGYVGAGRGMVTLYKEKAIVKMNVPENLAVDELIALIKENGDWNEP
jgi:(E)-4-hydroxy-3-methylbut-2-enyl-diphosphate synthase